MTPIYMKGTSEATVDQEPVGIVISPGSQEEYSPRFSAYMWAPDPEGTEDEDIVIEQRVA